MVVVVILAFVDQVMALPEPESQPEVGKFHGKPVTGVTMVCVDAVWWTLTVSRADDRVAETVVVLKVPSIVLMMVLSMLEAAATSRLTW